MAELITHGVNGLLCSDSAAEILSQLIELRDDPDLSEKLGRSGWELIQNERSWSENVMRTVGIFENELS